MESSTLELINTRMLIGFGIQGVTEEKKGQLLAPNVVLQDEFTLIQRQDEDRITSRIFRFHWYLQDKTRMILRFLLPGKTDFFFQ